MRAPCLTIDVSEMVSRRLLFALVAMCRVGTAPSILNPRS